MGDIFNLNIQRAGAEDINRRPDSILCQARSVGVELFGFAGISWCCPERKRVRGGGDNDKLPPVGKARKGWRQL